MKIDISSMLNEIKTDSKSKAEVAREENECYKMLCDVYEEIKCNSELSKKTIMLNEPKEQYKILDRCRNGSIIYSNGSWGSYHSNIYFYMLEPKNPDLQYRSGIYTSHVGPRGGDRGDSERTYQTVEEGLKEFLKKIIS